MKERVMLRKIKTHMNNKNLPEYIKFVVLYLESDGNDRLCYADILSFNCPYCDKDFNPESYEDCMRVFDTILEILDKGDVLYEPRYS